MGLADVVLEIAGIPGRVAPEVNAIRRAITPSDVRALDEKSRTLEFVASNEQPDRYGDVIRASGWNLTEFRRNPVFLWGHQSDEPPIGNVASIAVKGNELLASVRFAGPDTSQFADEIFRLYREKILRAVSVGFRPTKAPKLRSDDSGRTVGYEFIGQELLELSAVSIPANPSALMRAVDAGIVGQGTAATILASDDSDQADILKAVLELRKISAALTELRTLPKDILQRLGQLYERAKIPSPIQAKTEISTVEDLETILRGKP